jgi:hypothetical protein
LLLLLIPLSVSLRPYTPTASRDGGLRSTAPSRDQEQRRHRLDAVRSGATRTPRHEDTSLYPFVGAGWTTAMPYGLVPVATVAVVLKVLGSMIDSVLAPWFAT